MALHRPPSSANEIDDESRISDPCVKICVRDRESDICLGCGRTGKEVNDWTKLSRPARAIIVRDLDKRLQALSDKRRAKRSGRRGRLGTQSSQNQGKD
ncbi:MAG: DUF1289 domain-containing protein [Pseudomonadota bacterium]